jgi:hypothetical protein
LKYPDAFFQALLDPVPVTAPDHRNALGEITKCPHQPVAVEIHVFRHVPGHQVKICHVPPGGKHGIGQNKGINQSQMIGADQPRPSVLAHQVPDPAADHGQIPDPPAGKANGQDNEGRGEPHGKPAQHFLGV